MNFNLSELQNAFSIFDQEKGVILHTDIINVMKQLGENPDEQEVVKMMKLVNKNGKHLVGKICRDKLNIKWCSG